MEICMMEEEEKKKEIKELTPRHPIIVEVVAREVAGITATPTWAYMLLLLFIFITPYLAWFFGWSWWPNFGIYIIIAVIFGMVLAYWGRQRRRQASERTQKIKPDT
jgi:membrane protein implicated in regulation of membrane protease activity